MLSRLSDPLFRALGPDLWYVRLHTLAFTTIGHISGRGGQKKAVLGLRMLNQGPIKAWQALGWAYPRMDIPMDR